MKYWFIKSNEKVFPIDKMCKVLEVSFSSYYRWKRSSVSNKVIKKEHLKVVINVMVIKFPSIAGLLAGACWLNFVYTAAIIAPAS